LHVPAQLNLVALLDGEVLLRRNLRPAQREAGDDVAPGVADAVVALGAVESRRYHLRTTARQRERRHAVQGAGEDRIDVSRAETIPTEGVPVVANPDGPDDVRPG